MAYRNVYYNSKLGRIHLFTWDEDGNRVEQHHQFSPYFYTNTSRKDPDAFSIFGTPLKKHAYKNSFERGKAIKDGRMTKVYGNLPVQQQFLVDHFWKDCKKRDFGKHELAVFIVDIEVYSPNEFPDEWEAKHPINVITVYNSLKKEYLVFGVNGFDESKLASENLERLKKIKKDFNVVYVKCGNERKLLNAFLQYWGKNTPDVVSGWNLPFDMPYIINRAGGGENGEGFFPESMVYRCLSPVGVVKQTTRNKKMGPQYSMPVRDYIIEGVTVLDYQDLYMKFNKKPIPNRKLDTVAEIELKEAKVQHESTNLAELSEKDWDLFVFYNIIDVDLIRRLEEKLKFMEVARMLAYFGLCPLYKSLDTLPIVTGYCAVNAYEEGKVIPTFERDGKDWRTYVGGYVADPEPGVYKNIVSFDLNSLYPNTMITLNMSPETKLGKAVKKGNNYVFSDNNGNEKKIPVENFEAFLRKNKIAMSKSGVLFRQDKKGIFSKLVGEVYDGRVDDRKLIKENKNKINEIEDEIEKKKLEDENIRLDLLQYAKKIFINSVYGYLGNRYAPMSDIDLAESVTVTCQEVIQKSSEIINKIVCQCLQVDGKQYVRYQDTDSVAGDSIVHTKIGSFSIEKLFETYLETNKPKVDSKGVEIIKMGDLDTLYFDEKGQCVKWGKIKNLIRHKVTKKKYRIKSGNKEVFMTEDHSMMVYRGNELIEIKPSEFKKGDKIIIL